MGKARSLVNKLKRRKKALNKGRGFRSIDKIDKKDEVAVGSPSVFKLIRELRRKEDKNFGQQLQPSPEKTPDEMLVLADFLYVAEVLPVTGVAEVTDITAVADVAGSLNDTYFYLNSALDATEYYVWFNVSSGGTDPAIVGKTGIEVAISTGDVAADVAIAMEAAISAIADFSTSILGAVVTVTNAATGATTDASDAGSTGFTISVSTDGVTEVLAHVAYIKMTLTSAIASFVGLQVGDIVKFLSGSLLGKELSVIELVSATEIALEDDASFSSPESSTPVKLQISGVKKSYV